MARKNIWMLSVSAGLVVLLLAGIGIYRTSMHRQRMQAQQIRSLQQENKIGILKAAAQAEDNERSRLARELHDGIGGMLSASIMRFSTLANGNGAVAAQPAYHEAMHLLEGMGDEIRKTAHNLMPDILLQQDLPDALRTYCNTVQEGGSMQVNFQAYGVFTELPPDFRLNVYRIVQELLRNAARHAHASRVLEQLMNSAAAFTITVEDNGVGFDPAQGSAGLGLHNLRTRVESLDGQLTIDSAPGKGTSVFIEFNKGQ
jgi:signal transduction histidine kinase